MLARLVFAMGVSTVAGSCNLVFSSTSQPDAMADATTDAPSDAARGVPNYIGPGDYDGDGILNDVDPCPADDAELPNATVDSDGDGLPNVCDPKPNSGDNSKDCLVFFDGFTNRNGRGLDPRWVVDTGGSLAIKSNTLTFESDSNGRGFAHFELDVAANYVRAQAAMSVGVTNATSFIFAGVAASFERYDVDTQFGGAYVENQASTLQAATLKTGASLQPNASTCATNIMFDGDGQLSLELLPGKAYVAVRGCSVSHAAGLVGHKIAIGLARANIALSYISATRQLAPGEFCAHSKRSF